MGSLIITPTPPTPLDGPYVDLLVESLNPITEIIEITAGHWRGVQQHWEVSNFDITYYASAAVGNRIMKAHVELQGLDIFEVWTGSVMKDQTGHFLLMKMTDHYGSMVFTTPAQWVIGCSEGWLLNGYKKLTFGFGNPLAGDIVSATITLKYLNKELGIATPYDQGERGG